MICFFWSGSNRDKPKNYLTEITTESRILISMLI